MFLIRIGTKEEGWYALEGNLYICGCIRMRFTEYCSHTEYGEDFEEVMKKNNKAWSDFENHCFDASRNVRVEAFFARGGDKLRR